MSGQKRINFMWSAARWELLERVQRKLNEDSYTATVVRALQIAEAVVDKRATIDGREVVVPT